MRSTYVIFVTLLALTSCSGDNKNPIEETSNSGDIIKPPKSAPTENLSIPDNRFSSAYRVLLFGNSHVSGLGNLIKTLIKTGIPHANMIFTNANGGFLDNEGSYGYRSNLLENTSWTHVILQGQKYSQSGITVYPTISAQIWIDKAKQHLITPILFPEHPQRGNLSEGLRVHNIHAGIAARQKSCVAPVGLAWDKVLLTIPGLQLHSSDGNHASAMGQLLTSYVFYEVITGESADLLPFIESIPVEESVQQMLRQLASEIIQANPPCLFDVSN
jgi:hypothetical protein